MKDSTLYDVIVVGAGMGGLSAAATFARAGKKVLVLEKQNIPGGCATSFVRGRFEFEATLHEMCQMGDGGASGAAGAGAGAADADAGAGAGPATPSVAASPKGAVRALLEEYGLDVEWVAVEEAFRSINFTEDEGRAFDVAMPVGVEAFIEEMEVQCPGSRASMETVMELARMISDGVAWLAKHDNEPSGPAKIVMMAKYKDLMKLVPLPCDEALRRLGVPDKAREIFESYWDYVCVDSTRMSFAVYAFMTYTYLTQKPWIARHRSTEIALAFDKAIRDAGGQIWYNAPVAHIDVRDGGVRGVELEDGTYVRSLYVMSNLMPHTVFGRMVDGAAVPERDRRAMNARAIGSACVTVYLGLDIPYDELGFSAYDTFVRHTGDTCAQYEGSASIDGHRDYCVTILNEAIPDCSPAGTCMVQFSKFYKDDPFAGVRADEYFRLKDKLAEDAVRHFEALAGIDIASHIEEMVVATPATYARYIGTPRGAVYGYTPETWDGMFPRVQSGHKLDYTVRGLRFCGGHGTQMDGYSQSILSGREQARYMLADMKGGC